MDTEITETGHKVIALLSGLATKRAQDEDSIIKSFGVNAYFIKRATIATAFLEDKGLIQEFEQYETLLLDQIKLPKESKL